MRSRPQDLALAAALCALTLVMLAAGGFGTPAPRSTPLDLTGVLLAVAGTLPLAARRRPAAGYAVTAVAAFALLALGYPLDLPFGAIAGAYALAVAYSGDPWVVRRVAARAAIALFLPAAVLALDLAGYPPLGLGPELLGLALVFAGTWVLADRGRLRRAHLADLEERAAASERAVEREARLAAAQERTRIARELHDSAGHAITVILVQAGAARLLHGRDPERSLRAIGTIEDVARDTVGEIDRLVRALREEGPGDGPEELGTLLERHRSGGLRVTGAVPAVPRALPGGVGRAAYRILQEALTNAARHGAGTADVRLRYGPGAVELVVTNPLPATAPAGLPGGHGLVGMRERVALLGGTFTAGPTGPVWTVTAHLPYAPGARLARVLP